MFGRLEDKKIQLPHRAFPMAATITLDGPLSMVPRRDLCGTAFGLTATDFVGGFGDSGLRGA